MSEWWDSRSQKLNLAHFAASEYAADMRACPQDAIHHTEGDVWTHTLMVVEELQRLPFYQNSDEVTRVTLALAALLHDIAKPDCTEIDEQTGRISSPRHAKVGEQVARRLLWDVDFATRERICALVRLHGLPLWLHEKRQPNAAAISASLRLNNAQLHALAYADALGRICADKDDLLLRCDIFAEYCEGLNCLDAPFAFYNAHSQFKFFQQTEDPMPSEVYDDTQFEVTILVGLPGSGKDTYAAQREDLPQVSMDAIRARHKIDPTDSRAQGFVQQTAYEEAKALARRKTSFIWNSTNLTHEMRSRIIQTLGVYNPRFRIVYLETSMANILAARRDYIPASNLLKMQRILDMPTPDEAQEVEYIRWG